MRPSTSIAEAHYAARTWPHQRRILIKAEVVRADGKEPKDNPRFVITNMKQSPQWIYEKVYCQRGDIENRIKELHELQIDRTSCSDFWANQFRVLLTAAAYVLLQELRLRAAGTDCARAQVWTLRERLLKLGARVLGSVRRVVVQLPASFPVSSHLPASGAGTGSLARIALAAPYPKTFFTPAPNHMPGKVLPENRRRALFANPPRSPHHETTNITPPPSFSTQSRLPQTTLSVFMNKAG